MELLAPGSFVFDRYRTVAPLAAGGQAFGFYGIDTQASEAWARHVFLKQYHSIPMDDASLAALCYRLTTLRERLATNSHFICLPTKVGKKNNSLVMVFPKMKGQTLQEWMDDSIEQPQCVRFAQSLTKAVRIIHDAGVIHLDLKPDNVFIQSRMSAGVMNHYLQLIDLDSARIDGVGLQEHPMGTPMYYSPEHFAPKRFGAVSQASDVFTLGIMVYQLLFKEHPFQTATDYHQAVVDREIIVPASNYHADVVSHVIRCLSPNPERRPHASDLHRVLTRYNREGFETSDPRNRWTAGPIAGRRGQGTKSSTDSPASPQRSSKSANKRPSRGEHPDPATKRRMDATVVERPETAKKGRQQLHLPRRSTATIQLLDGPAVTTGQTKVFSGGDFQLSGRLAGPLFKLQLQGSGWRIVMLHSSNATATPSLVRWLSQWLSNSKRDDFATLVTARGDTSSLPINTAVDVRGNDELKIGSHRFRNSYATVKEADGLFLARWRLGIIPDVTTAWARLLSH